MALADLSAPTPLRNNHILDGFDSGEPVLDVWLNKCPRIPLPSASAQEGV